MVLAPPVVLQSGVLRDVNQRTLEVQARFEGRAMKAEEARRLWIEANHAEVLGDLTGAADLCRRILEIYPDSEVALDAEYYLRTGRRRDANRIELTMTWPEEKSGAKEAQR